MRRLLRRQRLRVRQVRSLCHGYRLLQPGLVRERQLHAVARPGKRARFHALRSSPASRFLALPPRGQARSVVRIARTQGWCREAMAADEPARPLLDEQGDALGRIGSRRRDASRGLALARVRAGAGAEHGLLRRVRSLPTFLEVRAMNRSSVVLLLLGALGCEGIIESPGPAGSATGTG